MRYLCLISLTQILLMLSLIDLSQELGNQCGIQYCTSCDPIKKFCYECDLPFKPGYNNQSICTRCSNNCLVCQKQGADSKGKCLSCQANFNYDSDDHCDTFYIWIYVVVIGAYAIFVISLIIIFCLMKRRKQRKNSGWFENLKSRHNIIDTDKLSEAQFQKMCQSVIQLLKESSSYNNLKFKDRQHQKAIKIKQIKSQSVKGQTHLKHIKIKAADHSEWKGNGYIMVPHGQNNNIKIWFVKNYRNRVYSEQISKIIIYQSISTSTNQIYGKWYYHDRPEIKGEWRGIKQPSIQNNVNVSSNNR